MFVDCRFELLRGLVLLFDVVYLFCLRWICLVVLVVFALFV